MKGVKFRSLCILFLISFCLVLNSCEINKNILQSNPEVDFTIPKRVQISFNERVYDTTIAYDGSRLEISFINENDLFSGALVTVDSQNYKILYDKMIFEGEKQSLSATALPSVVYSFFSSFENVIVLDSSDKERNCYYIKKGVNDFFVVLEAYEKENEETIYSMEIK